MSIMLKLMQNIPEGTVLKTPSRKKEFTVGKVSEKGVSVIVGRTEISITIPSSCFEGVPEFLREKGWMRIGAVHDVPFEGFCFCTLRHSLTLSLQIYLQYRFDTIASLILQ